MEDSFTCYNCCSKSFSLSQALTEQIPAASGGFHLKVSCPDCGKYVKFAAHEDNPKIHFGKYKGLELSEIACKDRNYLEWLITQEIKPKLHAQIIKALSYE